MQDCCIPGTREEVGPGHLSHGVCDPRYERSLTGYTLLLFSISASPTTPIGQRNAVVNRLTVLWHDSTPETQTRDATTPCCAVRCTGTSIGYDAVIIFPVRVRVRVQSVPYNMSLGCFLRACVLRSSVGHSLID